MFTNCLIRLGGMPLVVVLVLSAQAEDVRADGGSVAIYGGRGPAQGYVARMPELWTRVQQPGLATDERRLTFRDTYLLCARPQGRDLTARPQTVDWHSLSPRFSKRAGGGACGGICPQQRLCPGGPPHRGESHSKIPKTDKHPNGPGARPLIVASGTAGETACPTLLRFA